MKNLFAVIFALCTMLSVTLPTYAGPIRPTFGVRPSYTGGFRSTSPTYRTYSPTPSPRTYTYKSSAPSSPAPAAKPRTYSYDAPVLARPISRSTVRHTTVNHYHSDAGHSGGGMSLMDYAVLQSLASHNNSPTYINTPPAVAAPQPMMASSSDMGSYDAPAVIYQQEESHGWRNVFLTILALVIIAGIVAALVHYQGLHED